MEHLGVTANLSVYQPHSCLHKLTNNLACVFTQLTKLAAFSDDPFPAVTRILFTEADLQART